jgi:hypothetical protein
MFHVQLRHFPHSHSQFNLTAEELLSIAEPWARGEWVALGERRWHREQAKLTVLEGPQIPVQQLSMGRGWRHAQRHSEDVTERVLDGAGSAPSATTSGVSPSGPPAPLADQASRAGATYAGEPPPAAIGSLLGEGPRAAALLAAWQQTASRFPERSPSECLALAERLVEVSPEEFTR